jgi:hypothetical protein|tara:strand:- start:919 stop:2037 length:1119 start_codon:yes stop_codon:yes gene_type:complete
MKAGDAAVGLVACGTAWAVYLTKTRVDPFLSRRPFATVLGGGGGGGGRGHIVSSMALWKVVNVASYAMNVVSVSIPGRIDDQMAKEMKENKNNNSNKKDDDRDDDKNDEQDRTKNIRRNSKYRSLFTPAGYAFAIWGFIFTSEFVFVTRSSFFNTSDDTFAANATGFFALANVLQSAWCFTFRDWTEEPKRHWINAFVLGAEALALWMAKERVFEVNGSFSKESSFVSVPLRTHFAWIVCACGINLNTVVAKVGSASVQMFAAIGTAFAATAIGAYSSLRKGDAVTPLVFAWALYAIHKDGAHRAPPASPSKPDVDTKRAKSGGKVASTKNTSTNEIPSKTITKLFTDIVRACACINAAFAACVAFFEFFAS